MREQLTPSNPRGRRAVPVECKILVFLQYIANKNCIREISTLFGLSLSTVHGILITVSKAISNIRHRVIKWPTAMEQGQIEESFRTEKELPGCIGAIDGAHIELESRINKDESYVNRKGFPSILLQVGPLVIHMIYVVLERMCQRYHFGYYKVGYLGNINANPVIPYS